MARVYYGNEAVEILAQQAAAAAQPQQQTQGGGGKTLEQQKIENALKGQKNVSQNPYKTPTQINNDDKKKTATPTATVDGVSALTGDLPQATTGKEAEKAQQEEMWGDVLANDATGASSYVTGNTLFDQWKSDYAKKTEAERQANLETKAAAEKEYEEFVEAQRETADKSGEWSVESGVEPKGTTAQNTESSQQVSENGEREYNPLLAAALQPYTAKDNPNYAGVMTAPAIPTIADDAAARAQEQQRQAQIAELQEQLDDALRGAETAKNAYNRFSNNGANANDSTVLAMKEAQRAAEAKVSGLQRQIAALGGEANMELPSFGERLWNTVKGAAESAGAAYTSALGTLYAGGANAQGQVNSEIFEQKQKEYDREAAFFKEQCESYGYNSEDVDKAYSDWWDQMAAGIPEAERTVPNPEELYPQAKNDWNVLNSYKIQMNAYGTAASGIAQEGTKQNIYDAADTLQQKSAEDIQEAKRGTTGAESFLIDVGNQAVQMGADAAANAIAPGAGTISMAVRSFGSGAQEAGQNGADEGKAFLYGILNAALELGTEKMFDGLAGIYGKGAADDIVEGVITKLANTDAGKNALRYIANSTGEGAEEFVSDAVQPILQRLIYDEHALDDYGGDIEQWLYDGLVGAAMGGIGGAVDIVNGEYAAKNAAARRSDFNNALNQASAGFGTIEQGQAVSEANAAKTQVINALDSGRVNNTTAREISTDANLARAFTEETGIELDGTTAENVKTVQNAARERAYNNQQNALAQAAIDARERQEAQNRWDAQQERQAQETAQRQAREQARAEQEQAAREEQAVRESGYDSYIRGVLKDGVNVNEAREIARNRQMRETWERMTGKTLPTNEKSAVKMIMQTRRTNAVIPTAAQEQTREPAQTIIPTKGETATATQTEQQAEAPKSAEDYLPENVPGQKNNASETETESTGINTDPAAHTPEQQRVINGTEKNIGSTGTVLNMEKKPPQVTSETPQQGAQSDVGEPMKPTYNKDAPPANGEKYSQFWENTLRQNEESAGTPEDVQKPLSYMPISEKESLARASGRLSADRQGEVETLIKSEAWSGVQVDMSWQIASELYADAKKTGNYEAYTAWRKVMQEHTTAGAQGLQAQAKYTRHSGENALKAVSDKLADSNLTDEQKTAVINKAGEYAAKLDEIRERVQAEKAEAESGTADTASGKQTAENAVETEKTADEILAETATESSEQKKAEGKKKTSSVKIASNKGSGRISGWQYNKAQSKAKPGDAKANADAKTGPKAETKAETQKTADAASGTGKIESKSEAQEKARAAEKAAETEAKESENESTRGDKDRDEKLAKILLEGKKNGLEEQTNRGNLKSDKDLTDLIEGIANVRNTSTFRKSLFGRLLRQQDTDYLLDYAYNQIVAFGNDAVSHRKEMIPAKVKAYQVLAHLTSIPTFLRNIGGNATFNPIDMFAQNGAGVIIDSLVSKATGKRTVSIDKGLFSPTARRMAKEAMQKSILEVAGDVDMGSTNRYGDVSGRQFKMSGTKLEQFFSRWQQLIGYSLTTSDQLFKGKVEGEQFQGLNKLINEGKTETTPEEAMELAHEMALYRTFQNNGIASKASKATHDFLNLLGFGGKVDNTKLPTRQGGFGLGDLMNPYPGVPASLGVKALEFSPANIVKGGIELANLIADMKTNVVDVKRQQQAVMDIARGVSGIPLLALAAAATKAGLIKNWDDEEDKDVKALNAAEGKTGIQINFSAIGRWLKGEENAMEWRDDDALESVGWLEPLNAFLAIGSLIAMEGDDANVWDYAGDTAEGSIQALLELPVMSNISDLIDTMSYSDAENWLDKAEEGAIQYAGSTINGFNPSPVRNLAKALDDTYRDTYGDTAAETAVNTLLAGIPGLRETLPAKLDNFGNEKKYNGDLLERLYNTMLNPGDRNKIRQHDASETLEDVREATGDADIYPDRYAPYSITVGSGDEKQTYSLTKEQQRDYQKIAGGISEAYINELAGSEVFDDLTPEQQAEVIKQINSYAKEQAKANFLEGAGADYEASYGLEGSLNDPVQYLVDNVRISDFLEENDATLSATERVKYYAKSGEYSISDLEKIAEDKLGASQNYTFSGLVRSFGADAANIYAKVDSSKKAAYIGSDLMKAMKNKTDDEKLDALKYYLPADKNGKAQATVRRYEAATKKGWFSFNDWARIESTCKDILDEKSAATGKNYSTVGKGIAEEAAARLSAETGRTFDYELIYDIYNELASDPAYANQQGETYERTVNEGNPKTADEVTRALTGGK